MTAAGQSVEGWYLAGHEMHDNREYRITEMQNVSQAHKVR
jgi:hypothetical protein